MLLLKIFVQDFSEDGCPSDELENAFTAYRNSDILFYDPDLDSLLSSWKGSLELEGSASLLDFDRGYMTLLLVIQKSQALQKAVMEVFEKNYFDGTTRSSLQSRLELLDTYFEDACYTVDISANPLAYLGSDTDQKRPDAESRRDNEEDSNTTTTHTSKPINRRTPFVFAFLVPTVCLLSCIPADLACIHAKGENGTVTDAEFFQSLSSACLQLLGVATTLWPAIMNPRRNRTARIMCWTMAISGGVLALAAIPLYLVIPIRWSALLLFGGSILQALLQLQVVLGIYDFKEHQS
ncbi:hypothetical protein BJX65DRAFT_284333 [Aspergillus insuetus]